MCEPAFFPAMNAQVQKACRQFPKIATDICHELDVDEDFFNEQTERMKTDPFVRFRINRTLNRLARQEGKAPAMS